MPAEGSFDAEHLETELHRWAAEQDDAGGAHGCASGVPSRRRVPDRPSLPADTGTSSLLSLQVLEGP